MSGKKAINEISIGSRSRCGGRLNQVKGRLRGNMTMEAWAEYLGENVKRELSTIFRVMQEG